MPERLCVVMPVYNEQEAIGLVLRKWHAALQALGIDFTIRPYNDGSKDDSLAVMKKAAADLPHVDVRDKVNGGHGHTILTGYRQAAADGFDWVFQIDSDDEMGPEKFCELWAKRENYDFLVGIRDGRVQQLPRKVISFVSRLCVKTFYGRSVWDVNTPYRLMRVSAFRGFFEAIPTKTFAPNVILSGLVGRCKLRYYEIRVPQHDRTTGEVSIKKWKLLKAAAKSFMQTILFSFRATAEVPGMSKREFVTGSVLSWALFTVIFALIPRICSPGYDEVGTADTAVNLAAYGTWVSYVWQYSYNLLHMFLLTAWVKLFGVSHQSVCGMNVLLVGLTGQYLLCLFRRRNLCSGYLNVCAFVVMFWFSSLFWTLVDGRGRIDALVVLTTVVLLDELFTDRMRFVRLLAKSFLCMASGVYPVPLVLLLAAFTFSRAEDRKLHVKKTLVFLLGVFAAFATSCAIYAYEGQLIRFVHTYVSFNATLGAPKEPLLHRIVWAYRVTEAVWWVWAGIVVLLMLLRRSGRDLWLLLTFVALTPFFMVLAGRYTGAYRWMAYLPSAVLLAVALMRLRNPFVSLAALLTMGVWFGGFLSGVLGRNAQDAESDTRALRFAQRASSEGARASDVIIVDSLHYYAARNLGAYVWRPKLGTPLSPREKFVKVVRALPLSEAIRNRALEVFDRIQREEPGLPSSECVMLCRPDEDAKIVKDRLVAEGRTLTTVKDDGELQVLKVSARQSAQK